MFWLIWAICRLFFERFHALKKRWKYRKCLDIDDPHITNSQWWEDLWSFSTLLLCSPRDILFFRFFFQMRSFSNRFSNLYFHMPRMTQKLFQFYFQVCFLPFFVVGGDVLCVKEFKCLYTRHLAKAWQGMFLKKISRKNRLFLLWEAEEFSFKLN